MKKVKISKIILIIGIIAVICCISNISNASGNVNEIIHDITELPPDGNNIAQQPENNVNNVNHEINVMYNNITTNTTLPKTGVDDTIMWVLIGVCGLAAVYTYKKVRDYNV